MRVEKCLPLLSEATRQAILREQNQRLSVDSEPDLSARLRNPSFLALLWQSVSEMEQTVIRLFVQSSARGFFSKKQWERISGKQHRHLAFALTKLRRLGVVFTVRKMWSEIGYMMPIEVREQFTRILIAHPSEGQAVQQSLPYYISTGRGLHMDVFALLLFIRDQDVLLTQRRTIHRRFLLKMEPLVSFGEEHLKGLLVWRFTEAIRDDYPPGVAVALDVAMRLNLVYPEEKQLRINLSSVEQWLRQSTSTRWTSMYQLVCEHYLPHEPWLEAFVALMDDIPSDEWSSVDQLLEKLQRTGFDCPPDAKEKLREEWLHLLMAFGWIELGEGTGKELYWRWRGLVRSDWEEGWFVDPAGVVTIPPLVPLDAMWDLSRIGTLVFTGESIVCELQARPIQAFLSQGGSEERVLDILQRNSAHPLPDSVRDLVSHWGRSALQIRMEPMIRVRTANARLLEELRQIPSLAGFFGEVVTPTDFLVPLSQEREIFEALRRHGYEPVAAANGSWEKSEPKRHFSPDQEGAAGLFAIVRPWDGYAVENTFPDPLDSMPQLASLPKMWTQHLQAYHPQTLRDLFKRAQELQVEVQVQTEDGQVWQAVPTSVEVEMGYWYVSLEAERRKKRYRLDQIGRARIVVPEYL